LFGIIIEEHVLDIRIIRRGWVFKEELHSRAQRWSRRTHLQNHAYQDLIRAQTTSTKEKAVGNTSDSDGAPDMWWPGSNWHSGRGNHRGKRCNRRGGRGNRCGGRRAAPNWPGDGKSTQEAAAADNGKRHGWIFSAPRVPWIKGPCTGLATKTVYMRIFALCLRFTLRKIEVLTDIKDLFCVFFQSELLTNGYFKILVDIRNLLEMLLKCCTICCGRK
jgi:hypothetical protein